MLKALTASFLLGSAVSMYAQLPAPIAPQQIVYRHWPEQFVQWIGPELPYTMIELYVDPTAGSTPLYEVVLTERASGEAHTLLEPAADGRHQPAGGAPRLISPTCSSTGRPTRATAVLICCALSIMRVNRCRGNLSKALT